MVIKQNKTKQNKKQKKKKKKCNEMNSKQGLTEFCHILKCHMAAPEH